MRSIVTSIVFVMACSDLPSWDEPDFDSDSGLIGGGRSCEGSAFRCESQNSGQCGPGCFDAEVCRSPFLARCAQQSSKDACNLDAACDWTSDRCEPSDLCWADSFSEETCLDHGCNWGPGCDGDSRSCFDWENQSSCEMTPGCRWE